MKKISVNKEDICFENKYKFEDMVEKIKALGVSVIKNGKKILILGVMAGFVLFSSNSAYKIGTDIVEMVKSHKILQSQTVSSERMAVIQEYIDNGIFIANNTVVPIEQKYYFDANNMYDNEGNIISLKGLDKPVYFVNCKINEETLKNIELSASQTKTLYLDASSVDDNFVHYLPETLEELSLNKCNYITNLNDLPKKCPNITAISLNAAASLSDLSFIYQLPNLKEIYISDSAYITEELLTYLKEKNITTNITQQDVINSQKIDEIIGNIITPNMSDRKKIQAVCSYVLENSKYDISLISESNNNPLTCFLENGKGVCASYAYLTNVLLNKAGIKSFEVVSDSHGWNLVKLDDKYYYIDTTNMDDSAFYNFLLKVLNITKYYMIDTENTFITSMSKPSDDVTIIPKSLIDDIQAGRDNKNIFEKYGGQIGNYAVILGSILQGLSIPFGLGVLKGIIQDAPILYYDIKNDYEEKKKAI